MKIIHTADIHLGSRIEAKLSKDKAEIRRAEVRQAFNKMVSFAALNDIKVILIAGDLFDSARPLQKDKEFFYSVVKNNPDIDFIYLRGNHDDEETADSDIPSNLKLFGDEWQAYIYEDVAVYGAERPKSSWRGDENSKNIVAFHGMAEDMPAILDKNIDYLAMGHVHTFSEVKVDIRGKAIYSGCLEGRGFDEIGIKGFVVINTEDMSHEFVPNSIRVIDEFDVDISKAADSYEAYKIIKDEIDTDSNNLCVVRLCGEISFDDFCLEEDISGYFRDEYFYVYVKNNTQVKINYEAIAKEETIKGEFVRLVLSNKMYSDEQKERIVSVGIRALEGKEVFL